MSEEQTKEVKMIAATGELRRAIEDAGEKQAARSTADSAYKVARAKLNKLLEEHADDDVPVYAKNYWAIRSHDKHDAVDPIDIFEKFKNSKKLIRKFLSVNLTKLKEHLKGQEDILESLIDHTVDEDITLHVNKIKKEE